ncbi:MAG: hypothetical protein ACRDXB_21010, partial [Actinomycetes bacterium]
MIRLRVTKGALRGKCSRVALATMLLSSLLFGEDLVAAAASEDYGEYSLMTQRHAGRLYSDGRPAGQWSWTPRDG